jgi:hypothetical protein
VPAPHPPPAPGPTAPAPNPPAPPDDDDDADDDDADEDEDDDDGEDDDREVGESVTVKGTVQLLAGSCPNLVLRVADTSVVANRKTDFRKVKCGNVREDMHVTVKGKWQADESILAEKIEKD